MTQSELLGQVHVAVIRLDAKMDHITDELSHVRNRHSDHEARLRHLEAQPRVTVEAFARLEDRPYVSPATVWKVIGSVGTFAGIAVAVIAIFVK